MSSFNKYPHVFSPIKIGNMEVKNRIQFSPMVSSLSTPTGGVSPGFSDTSSIRHRAA